ncbi:MAG: hypothetical protein Q9225_000860 [Loekoesia sp. 1 TL-2023]
MHGFMRRRYKISDLRKMIGIKRSSASGPIISEAGGRHFVFIGHDLREDSTALSKYANDQELSKAGCHTHKHLDTYKQMQKCDEDTQMAIGLSLTNIVVHYKVARLDTAGSQEKPAYSGAHNAGNDAATNLQAQLRMAFDFTLHDGISDDFDPAVKHDSPVPYKFEGNVILICIDAEHVDHDNYKPWRRGQVTELGFAWLDTQDLIDEAPGHGCQNWFNKIEYSHIRVQELLRFRQRFNKRANPEGFNFGTSVIVKERDLSAYILEFLGRLASRPIILEAGMSMHSDRRKILEAEEKEEPEPDHEPVAVDEAIFVLQLMCPHSLRGEQCSTTAPDCQGRLYACPGYPKGLCQKESPHPKLQLGQYEDNNHLLYHVLPTCKSILKGKECLHAENTCGRDHIEYRLAIEKRARAQAAERKRLDEAKGLEWNDNTSKSRKKKLYKKRVKANRKAAERQNDRQDGSDEDKKAVESQPGHQDGSDENKKAVKRQYDRLDDNEEEDTDIPETKRPRVAVKGRGRSKYTLEDDDEWMG